jgi:hypothetical protein
MRISRTAATRAPAERGIVMKRSAIVGAVLTVGTVLGCLLPWLEARQRGPTALGMSPAP